MGRQIGIFATQQDVDNLLLFLRATTEIAVFRGFAESIEALWIERPQLSVDWTFYVWNKQFSWVPEYRRVGENAYSPDRIGLYYVANDRVAPIIEISCGDLSKNHAGRIYWSKDFAAPHGLDYDVRSFAAWYEIIVKWIRKNGRKLVSGWMEPYYLPEAWNALASSRR